MLRGQAKANSRRKSTPDACFPGLPEQDFCVYDIHEVNRDFPDGWTYQDSAPHFCQPPDALAPPLWRCPRMETYDSPRIGG